MWKNEIAREIENIDIINLDTHGNSNMISHFINQFKICNSVYWCLNKGYTQQNKNNIRKWNEILHTTEDKGLWEKINTLTFHATLDSKLRTFQYKLVRRILPTNIQLKLYGIKENDVCDLCRNEIETYEHLFCDCEISGQLIADMVQWFHPYLVIQQNLIPKKILLGYTEIPCLDTANLINTLMIITKYFIYKCKCKNILPTFRQLKLEIKLKYLLEKDSHHFRTREKWKPIEPILTAFE